MILALEVFYSVSEIIEIRLCLIKNQIEDQGGNISVLPYNFSKNPYFCCPNADVAKLADALDLGSSAERHVGSTPIIRT
jgi:hypothetical protein